MDPNATLHGAAMFSLLTMTGNEVCVAVFVEPVLRGADDAVQRVLAPRTAAVLGKWMPLWYAVSLLLTIADWWLARNSLVAASLGVQVVILTGTLTLLVPINNRLARGALRPGWLSDARQWDRYHQLRVVLLLAASGLLLASR